MQTIKWRPDQQTNKLLLNDTKSSNHTEDLSCFDVFDSEREKPVHRMILNVFLKKLCRAHADLVVSSLAYLGKNIRLTSLFKLETDAVTLEPW